MLERTHLDIINWIMIVAPITERWFLAAFPMGGVLLEQHDEIADYRRHESMLTMTTTRRHDSKSESTHRHTFHLNTHKPFRKG